MKDFNSINSEISKLIRSRKYDLALELIDNQVSKTNDPYLYVSKAHILVVAYNDKENAKKILESILKCSTISFPTRKYALSEYARIASMEEDIDKALECYKEIIEKSKYVEPVVRCRIANIYIEKDMHNEALAVLDVPDYNDEAMNAKRCKVFIKEKKFEEALAALNSPIFTSNRSVDSGDVFSNRTSNETNYYYGLVYHNLNEDLDKVIYYFKKVIDTNDYNDVAFWAALSSLIFIYYGKQMYTQCIDYCKLFLDKKSHSSKYFSKVSKTCVKAYLELERFDEALELAKKYDFKALELYANACKKIKTFDFISAYEDLCNIDSNDEGFNIEILFKKLICMYRLNRVEEFDKLYFEIIAKSTKSKYILIESRCMKQYLYKKNNMSCSNSTSTYFTNQIRDYDENNLKIYLINNSIDRFVPDTNFTSLIDEVKKRIEVMKPRCAGLFDEYVLLYPNIGYDENKKETDSLIIKCLPDSKDIVLILPISNEVKHMEEPQQKQFVIE